jgi:general secretion pathway protein A
MYTAYYHLREEPFRLTSDPRFFHLAEPHAAALAILVEAVTRRKGFVVMTGQIGTGKTTVLHTALQILSEREAIGSPIASAFILNPMLTREEFLETLITEFEIPCMATGKPARLSALQGMLLNMQRKGGTSVLMVDEAHLLSPEVLEEIRLLSNADTYQEKLLQIVLCGPPELLPMLRRPELQALRQRVAGSCELRPLSFPEVRAYIAERMYAAGFRGSDYPFPSAALEGILRHTEGVPRLINLLCDACLSIGYKTQRRIIQVDIVEEGAIDLGLQKIAPELVAQENIADPGTRKYIRGEGELESAVDVLIAAMKLRRASATKDSPSVQTVQEMVVGPKNGNVFSSNAVMESAVDVLIEAMKLKRASVTE